jgi:hypothetical protein
MCTEKVIAVFWREKRFVSLHNDGSMFWTKYSWLDFCHLGTASRAITCRAVEKTWIPTFWWKFSVRALESHSRAGMQTLSRIQWSSRLMTRRRLQFLRITIQNIDPAAQRTRLKYGIRMGYNVFRRACSKQTECECAKADRRRSQRVIRSVTYGLSMNITQTHDSLSKAGKGYSHSFRPPCMPAKRRMAMYKHADSSRFSGKVGFPTILPVSGKALIWPNCNLESCWGPFALTTRHLAGNYTWDGSEGLDSLN